MLSTCEGLVGVLPQLSERQSDDVSIVDDIIEAVTALHQQCKHDADNRSFSSVSYECVEFDEASQQSSSSDADKSVARFFVFYFLPSSRTRC